MPPPLQTVNMHVTRESRDALLMYKLHKDEPNYMALSRLIEKYQELKRMSLNEYQILEERYQDQEETLRLAEFDVTRLKQIRIELESKNEQLERELEMYRQQYQQQPKDEGYIINHSPL